MKIFDFDFDAHQRMLNDGYRANGLMYVRDVRLPVAIPRAEFERHTPEARLRREDEDAEKPFWRNMWATA